MPLKTVIELREQVVAFLRMLPPDSRKAMRAGLRDLERGHGDTKALEGELEGFHRLRVGSFRILYRETFRGGRRFVDCLFAERRSVVYEAFSDLADLFRPD